MPNFDLTVFNYIILKKIDVNESPSILFWLSLRPLLKLDFYHFNCLCDPQSDLIRAGNYLQKSKTQYLNAIKAEQLMADKQLLISTPLIK